MMAEKYHHPQMGSFEDPGWSKFRKGSRATRVIFSKSNDGTSPKKRGGVGARPKEWGAGLVKVTIWTHTVKGLQSTFRKGQS